MKARMVVIGKTGKMYYCGIQDVTSEEIDASTTAIEETINRLTYITVKSDIGTSVIRADSIESISFEIVEE